MINRKKNVLHLLLSLEMGGMERFVYEHCLALEKDKFNISVCCIDRLGGFCDPLRKAGVNVDLVQKKQNSFDWFFPFKLKKYLLRNNIDILHIHTGSFFYGAVAGFLAKTPGIVYTEHGRHLVEPWQLYILDQISSWCVDEIVTVSEELETHLIDKMKLPKKKIKTIINGVNTQVYQPRDKPDYLLNEFSIEVSTKIIGAVGRLAEIKDHVTLIKAFSLIKKQDSNTKLIIVGEGPCEENLKSIVSELSLKNDVFFTGNRTDIPSLLNLIDVFVLPSLMEGTSISLLEAMSSGVPCVVTNVGGNKKLISNNVSGFTVSPRNESFLSEKIMEILTNKELALIFSAELRKTTKKHYSFVENINKYRNIYDFYAS